MSEDKIVIELTPRQAGQVLDHLKNVAIVAAGQHMLLYDTANEKAFAWERSPLGQLEVQVRESIQVYANHAVDEYAQLRKQDANPTLTLEYQQPETKEAAPPFCPKPDNDGTALKPGDYVLVKYKEVLCGVVVVSDTLKSVCEDGLLAPGLVVKLEDGKIINPASKHIEKLTKVYVVGDRDDYDKLYSGPFPSLKRALSCIGQEHGDRLYEVTENERRVVARWSRKVKKWKKVKKAKKV
jgi:hypothetical protein